MPKGKWGDVGKQIYYCLRLGGSLELSIPEIIAAAKSSDQAAAAGDHNWWTSAKRGDENFAGLTKCGLVMTLHPDEPGKPVRSVTFHREK